MADIEFIIELGKALLTLLALIAPFPIAAVVAVTLLKDMFIESDY